MTQNQILFSRRKQFLIPQGTDQLAAGAVAAFIRNCEGLGYVPDQAFIEAFGRLNTMQAQQVHQEILVLLQQARGVAHYQPMYPNFPDQVMSASDAELYINATLHYVTAFLHDITAGAVAVWQPRYAKLNRPTLRDQIRLETFGLATEQTLVDLFDQIVSSNTSLSAEDLTHLTWFVEQGDVTLDKTIPHRENLAHIAALLIQHSGANPAELLKNHVKTATDVLRVAVALSAGDVSLSESTRFGRFDRKTRRALVQLLDQCGNLDEDLGRWHGRWLRLSERLHTGEYATRWPQAHAAVQRLRTNTLAPSFASTVESLLRNTEPVKTALILGQRPGEFARRLDQILRQTPTESQDRILELWQQASGRVSTTVLLQTRAHFVDRQNAGDVRVFFPKGNVAKVKSVANTLPDLADSVCAQVVSICDWALTNRFAQKPSLGRVYVDPKLAHYLLPFSQRSASTSRRRLVRGSQVSLEPGKDTVRFFVHWRDGEDRTDLDLSAALYNDQWQMTETVAYYNLRSRQYRACHSGDITSAPQGAAEYIDIDLASVVADGSRYVVMMVNSFTGQAFNTIPDISAGWMLRNDVGSGEIFESATVVDRFDITNTGRQMMPLIIDAVERRVIWCDVTIKINSMWANNVAGNANSIGLVGRAFTQIHKPNCYDLFRLHALSRGSGLVTDPADADTVFSVNAGITPDQLELIASEYMQ